MSCVERKSPPAADADQVLWIRARLLFGIGEVTAASENACKALAPLEQSLAIFRQLGNQRDLIFVRHRLSETLSEAGAVQQAVTLLEETLPLARALDDRWLVGRTLSILSSLATDLEEFERAEALANEALVLLRNGRDTGTVVYLLNVLGHSAAERGDLDRAESLLEEALTINRTITRMRMGAAWTVRNLGMVAQRRRQWGRARAYFQESLILRYELRQISGSAWAMEGLAEVESVEGDPRRAVALWATAAALRSAVGVAIE